MRALSCAILLVLAACGPRQPRVHELRLLSSTYAFNIVAQPSPPHAREAILYKVVIRDRELPPHPERPGPVRLGGGPAPALLARGASVVRDELKAGEASQEPRQVREMSRQHDVSRIASDSIDNPLGRICRLKAPGRCKFRHRITASQVGFRRLPGAHLAAVPDHRR